MQRLRYNKCRKSIQIKYKYNKKKVKYKNNSKKFKYKYNRYKEIDKANNPSISIINVKKADRVDNLGRSIAIKIKYPNIDIIDTKIANRANN